MKKWADRDASAPDQSDAAKNRTRRAGLCGGGGGGGGGGAGKKSAPRRDAGTAFEIGDRQSGKYRRTSGNQSPAPRVETPSEAFDRR